MPFRKHRPTPSPRSAKKAPTPLKSQTTAQSTANTRRQRLSRKSLPPISSLVPLDPIFSSSLHLPLPRVLTLVRLTTLLQSLPARMLSSQPTIYGISSFPKSLTRPRQRLTALLALPTLPSTVLFPTRTLMLA